MSFWRQLTRGLRVLTRRRAADQELAEEMHDYLEQETEANIARGLSPDAARHAAKANLGSATAVREQVRASGWENLISTLLADLRYAARHLRNNPGFTSVSVLTLALGIGASTAIFSAVNPILFEPLPYRQPSHITMVWEMRRNSSPRYVTFGTFRGLKERAHSFDSLAVMKAWQPAMTGDGQPERFEGQRVSADYFRVLGVSPARGRDFTAEDDQFHGPHVVILSDGLWRRRFGGDSTIVGREIRLDDNLYTVIGVMRASFENALAPSAELWAPLQYDPSLPVDGKEWGHHLRMVGRLKTGSYADGRVSDARNELNVLLPSYAEAHSAGYKSSGGPPDGMIVTPLQDDLSRGVRPALLAIVGAVTLLLLIACVNVTNLLLARGGQRRGEFAMRAALGAGRARLIRQLLTESLLLSAIGGILGVLVAAAGIRVLVALAPTSLPRAEAIHLDGGVLAFGVFITGLVGLVVGVVPSLHASRAGLQSEVQQSSRRSSGGRHLTRRALVVSEVSLAIVLLVSAGLLLRSLQRLFSVDPGFDSSHLITMQVQETGRRYDSDGARARFYSQALERVRRLPGVTAAAFTSQLPLSGDFDMYGLEVESASGSSQQDGLFRYSVSPGYFDAMRIRLRRGRLLDERDHAGAPVSVLISSSLANRIFSGQDPIGKRVRIGPDIGKADRPWNTIVGVVDDVKQASLGVNQPEAFYTANDQWTWVDNVQSLVVRAPGDAASMISALRNAIWSIDKDQPIVRVATMDSLLTETEAERRFALVLFAAFGIAALVLVASGTYGILSGGVTERTREIGVRLALGASPRNILRLILRQGLTLTALGTMIGVCGAAIASRALATLLFGITRLDPMTYLGVVALLGGVSMIACWVPAWRAARVDPAITLRAE